MPLDVTEKLKVKCKNCLKYDKCMKETNNVLNPDGFCYSYE